MKEYNKALEVAGQASEADVDRRHTSEIEAHVMKINQAMYSQRAGETDEQTLQRAMKDPEVAVRLHRLLINSC